MQISIPILASFFSGGLAGAFFNAYFSRFFRRRELRTKFHPVLNNMFSAYVIRMEKPEGRYWTTVVGKRPAPEDENFVDHRSNFIGDIVQYNELKEVRLLWKQMMASSMGGNHNHGEERIHDLSPELKALGACLVTVQKKLKLT